MSVVTLPVDGASTPSLGAVIQAAADHYGEAVEDLIGERRTEPLTSHRHVAMYVCRELVGSSYPTIADAFGGRDHTSIMHAVSKVAGQLRENPQTNRDVTSVMAAARRRPETQERAVASPAITAAVAELRRWRALHARELSKVDAAIRALEALVADE